ncbi:hypothetical protein ANN_27571 [Periplaneta americana]|uniref:Reverse transcriptase domain-containing protein n=1 Tax=Periplaneta americana TaxID=6978 RepID=A0ABQ8RWD1_PERAM|nr:hypothetical protein ANN_27571 [Periplaneta americana]
MGVSNLLQEIQNAITEKQIKSYVLCIDYQKAFDSVNRQLLVTKLDDVLGRSTLTRLIGNIMAENYIQINDSAGESNWISKKNGVLQGDPLSPMLFNILTYDVGREIKANTKSRIYIYADDMALVSENVEDLQKATDILGKSINSIGNLLDMSIISAMKLFEAKIWPTCTDGLEMIWEYLSEKQLRDVESIKSRYLKRALELCKYSFCQVQMDLIKMEPDINPLPMQLSDTEEKKPLSEQEGNLLDLPVTRIKEECVDDSYNNNPEIKFEEIILPNNFPVMKCEPEEETFVMSPIKEESMLEVTTEESEVLTESHTKSPVRPRVPDEVVEQVRDSFVRFPSLTRLYCFISGFDKDWVFVQPLPANVAELRNWVYTAVAEAVPDMLHRMWEEIDFRWNVCRMSNWSYSEPY